jgi:UDP-N-acetylglucosamine--N-acetylmuramyl-(pentapeptide) pyrophosphoryl-undecaprenol N-acetylglucosamine transferase
MKVLITAGGGGHFSAALAVILQLPKEMPYILVGRKYAFEADNTLSFESKLAKELGIPFKSISSSRLQRHFDIHSLRSLFRFPKSFYEAYTIVRLEKPDLVLSFGGYTSVPIVFAAALLRIPIVIHEQTLHAGLANTIASYFAKAICISWEASAKYFPKKKVVLTGNPIRFDLMMEKDFFKQEPIYEKDIHLPVIYVTGGSLGSHPINLLLRDSIEKLLKKYVVIHQTGAAEEFKDFEMLEGIRKTFPENLQRRYILTKFVSPQMLGSIYQKSDLVIGRSGINTVSELLYFGKPTLFIPLPFAQKNEQMVNALFFKKQGLGEVFEQKNLTGEKLYEYIVSMMTHRERYIQHAKKAKELITVDAVKHILAVCEKALYD